MTQLTSLCVTCVTSVLYRSNREVVESEVLNKTTPISISMERWITRPKKGWFITFMDV